ncbi:class I SAM-dependent methyltransferase, partial [Nocardia sp. NPDC058497]|uniref:class I SAM-dependent methyltransferase n=1 Tax=Nocardia sp. NPDC058497 TaxID=3346529 RepID=UPI003663E429
MDRGHSSFAGEPAPGQDRRPVGPSRTAIGAAVARAVHQVVDGARVFTDPLALAVLGMSEHDFADRQRIETLFPTDARLFIAGRQRFAEDALKDAVSSGTAQVVLLGAGIDTLAYRADLPDCTIWELDQPPTQQWKRRRLAAAGIAEPDNVRFAPIDFATDSLHDVLSSAGFDRHAPAFYMWLGVVPYLTLGSVRATLQYI